jgi:F0F1-type ATP synthase membrane subunit b/b'
MVGICGALDSTQADRRTKMDRSTQTEPDQDRVTDETSHLVDTARDEAGRVADEAKRQGKELYHEAANRTRREAQEQTSRAAESIRSLSRDLRSMTEGQTDTQTSAASLIRQGAGRIESFADHVEQRGFDGLMDDVSRFARRKPGTFLAVTFGAGLVTARVLRNVSGDNNGQDRGSADSDRSGTLASNRRATYETSQPGEAAGSPSPTEEEDFSREEYPR